MLNKLVQLYVNALLLSSLALVLILSLRPLLKRYGAPWLSYLNWLLLPLLLVAPCLPLPATQVAVVYQLVTGLPGPITAALNVVDTTSNFALYCCLVWLVGFLISLAYFAIHQWRYQSKLGLLQAKPDYCLSAHSDHSPMLLGLFPARIIMPADFYQRYDCDQQTLILAHEQTHLRHGDQWWNFAYCGLRCVLWANPLIHWAQHYFRFDQELACDASVMQAYPQQHSSYAQAMLNTVLQQNSSALSCNWQSNHPLKERIMQLKKTTRPFANKIVATLLAVVASCSSYLVWANQNTNPLSNALPKVSQAEGTQYAIHGKIQFADYEAEHDIHTAAGQTSFFSFKSGSDNWTVHLLVDSVEKALPDQYAKFSEQQKQKYNPQTMAGLKMEIFKNKDLVSSPKLMVGLNHDARVETKSEVTNNQLFAISLKINTEK